MVTPRADPIVTAMLSASTEPSLVARVLPTTKGGRDAMVALQTTFATIASA
jgi:hypothetical protein